MSEMMAEMFAAFSATGQRRGNFGGAPPGFNPKAFDAKFAEESAFLFGASFPKGGPAGMPAGFGIPAGFGMGGGGGDGSASLREKARRQAGRWDAARAREEDADARERGSAHRRAEAAQRAADEQRPCYEVPALLLPQKHLIDQCGCIE
jgi:hypothetical protein